MRLPDALDRAIDLEASAVPGKALARAAESLSARYRGRPGDVRPAPSLTPLTDIERLAYAVVRAPATYAAVSTVLAELRQRAPDLRVERLLDLGAGPGAATWAALAQRDDLERVTLIERDRGFIDLGTRLLARAPELGRGHGTDVIEWQCVDLNAVAAAPVLSQPLPSHDLVVMSYALGELSDLRRIVERAWKATEVALVVIEPGTPFHFARMLEARDHLIREGALIIAPCPHAFGCPMAGGDDWCHMPARVERTSLHRRLKAGALPYEDEKFSYLIALGANASASGSAQRAAARIVRRPEVQKGFIALPLCTPHGLRREGVPRSQRDAFRRARKAAWGDAW